MKSYTGHLHQNLHTLGYGTDRSAMFTKNIQPDDQVVKEADFENLLPDKNIIEAIQFINLKR